MANQNPSEFGPFLDYLSGRVLRRVLEIGTQFGGTTWIFSQIATDDATIVSVDDGTQFTDEDVKQEAEKYIAAFNGRAEQQLFMVQGNSHDPAIRDMIEARVDGPFDLLLIDGDHSYEGVKQDWEMYSPLVSPGGLVAFHDIVEWAPDRNYGVHILWAQIKNDYVHHEFYADGTDAAGLGVIEIPE
jgi:predicted O-methyltransferase YrrM